MKILHQPTVILIGCLLLGFQTGFVAHGQSSSLHVVSNPDSGSIKPHALAYNGQYILGHAGYDVYLWSAQTGRRLHKYVGHKENVVSAEFSPDGQHFLTSSWLTGGPVCLYNLPQFRSKDTSIRYWDLDNGQQIWALMNERFGSLSSDGRLLLTFSLPSQPKDTCGAADGVTLWDTQTGKRHFTITGVPTATGFSADSRVFLVQYGSTAVLYDTSDGHAIVKVPKIDSFHFYGAGHELLTASGNVVERWDGLTGEREDQITLQQKANWDSRTKWGHDGRAIISLVAVRGTGTQKGTTTCQILRWRVTSGEIAGSYSCTPEAVYNQSVFISPNDAQLLIAWGGTTVEKTYVKRQLAIIDLQTGEESARVRDNGAIVGYSPDGQSFATDDGAVTVYDSHSGRALVRLTLPIDEVAR